MRQVVFIMTDSTRKDMLGCYGLEKMITPNLDQLAREGIKYENAYTTQPVCGPARSAIFTGLYPHSNGVVANSISLGDNVKTIGQRLNDNGIHCGYIGKWHLDGSDYFGNGICPEGWDKEYWYDMRTYLEELTDEEKVKSRKDYTAYEKGMTEEFTYGHRCSNRGIAFLDAYKETDFFLALSYDEPHDPSLCPKPYNQMYQDFSFPDNEVYDDTLENKPFMQKLWAGKSLNKTAKEINQPSETLSLFLGCNTFVDYEIGRVLKKIKEVVPNALVIFTSDHGAMLGAHKLSAKNATMYKEVANVPLIIKGGEVNKVVTEPASHIDMVPTILEYMGINIPKVLEGKSILKQINNVSETINEAVFCEFTRYEVDHDGFGGLQMMRGIVTEKYKLTINLFDTDELYDISVDPNEMINQIDNEDYEIIRNKLHDKLLEHMDETRDVYRGYQWACRSWRPENTPSWSNGGYTRQRENEEYEPRQLDYDTGLPMKEAVRTKHLNRKMEMMVENM